MSRETQRGHSGRGKNVDNSKEMETAVGEWTGVQEASGGLRGENAGEQVRI